MRFTVRRKLAAAVITCVCAGALGLAGAATAAPASAAGTVHGCPSGDACGYNTPALFASGNPISEDVLTKAFEVDKDVVTYLQSQFVNNSDPEWTSEGTLILFAHFGGLLNACVYVPDLRDVQAPDTIENPADGASVDATASGPTQASVSAQVIVGLDDCTGG